MKLDVIDCTIRDGEQQVGVNFRPKDKLLLVRKSIELGVLGVETMPIACKQEEEFCKQLIKKRMVKNVFPLTLFGKEYIDHAHELGFRTLICFTSVSKRLMSLKGMNETKSLQKARFICKYGSQKGLKIYFAGEDSSRADNSYLVRFIRSIQKDIEGFIICDTVGILTPTKTKKLIRNIKRSVDTKLGVHFHNDQGLANENSKIAIKEGATILSATFGGIGERAGNADIGKVLTDLKKEDIIFDNIDYQLLSEINKLVYKLGGSKPAKPFSQRAFRHEAGIHVSALLKDPLSYNPFPPEKFGKKNQFFYGKYSGTANIRCLFGNDIPDKICIAMRDKLKDSAYKNNRSYNGQEARSLLKDYLNEAIKK